MTDTFIWKSERWAGLVAVTCALLLAACATTQQADLKSALVRPTSAKLTRGADGQAALRYVNAAFHYYPIVLSAHADVSSRIKREPLFGNLRSARNPAQAFHVAPHAHRNAVSRRDFGHCEGEIARRFDLRAVEPDDHVTLLDVAVRGGRNPRSL